MRIAFEGILLSDMDTDMNTTIFSLIFLVINFILYHLQVELDAVPHLVGDGEGAALLGDVGYVF